MAALIMNLFVYHYKNPIGYEPGDALKHQEKAYKSAKKPTTNNNLPNHV
jgi:hypothetical protein